jgi:hypothetical protein
MRRGQDQMGSGLKNHEEKEGFGDELKRGEER